VRRSLLDLASRQLRRARGPRTVEAATVAGPLLLSRDDKIITPWVVSTGCWEAGDTALFQELLRPGMTFVDIGAHVGYFSLLAAPLVGETGRVLAFEPHPENFELLQANVRNRSLTNVSCYPWAVGAANGRASLYLAVDNSGDHRIEPAEEERTRIEVPLVALDSVPEITPPLQAVKIDIQGAEEAAVRGMERLLAASPEVFLVLEFWPYGIERSGGDPRRVLDYYRSLGFVVRAQDPEVAGPAEWSDDEILEFCTRQDGWQHASLLLTRV
jgi:FkbM family methyltransferase